MINKLQIKSNGGHTKLILNGQEIKGVIDYTLSEDGIDCSKLTLTLDVAIED